MGHQYMQALCETFKDFFKETSATGFQHLVNPKQTWLERCIWLLLQIFLFAATLIMILHTVGDSLKNPLVTSLESVRYSIENIDFPGISICNINKMSKKRVIEYAKLISEKGNLPFEDAFNQMKMLGKFYDFEVGDVNDFLTFQTYLEKYGIIDNATENTYFHYIMKNLSTPCEELLYRCNWKGKKRNCSEIFDLRRTYEGFCCTFNYVRYKGLQFGKNKDADRLPTAGWDTGLTVVIRNEPDDYFYPLISSVGVNVHIFNPHDYPDDTSGGLIQELVDIGTETFLNLNAKTIYSVPDVRKYPVSIRNCIFPNEVTTSFGTYSRSNCLVQCRVESILGLCNCVPFIIPWYTNISQCTLSDIPCLNKYKGKWQSLYPQGYDSDELEYEKQNSLWCANCHAACAGTQYSVSTNWAPLHMRGPAKQKYENFSVIRVYYGNHYTKLFRQDVLYYWFETLSNIGGVLGIFLGVSFMSVVEFLYFITFRFIFFLKKLKN